MPLLEVRNLRTVFRTEDGPVTAVNGLSFSLEAGETLGIVGESGSGKTVTALSIMRLLSRNTTMTADAITLGGENLWSEADQANEAEVLRIDGELNRIRSGWTNTFMRGFGGIFGWYATIRSMPLTLRRARLAGRLRKTESRMRRIRGRRIAMIFQDPMTSLNPVLTIGEQIAETVRLHLGLNRAEGRRKAIEMLEKVRMPAAASRLDDYPHQFSGGMRQRVMIAMALSCNPELLIADEPTTALDVTIQAQILELMNNIQKETGTAIILITHDLGVVAEVCRNVLVMYAGNLVEYGQAEAIFEKPRMPYTQGLLASLPRLDLGARKRLVPIKGQPPNLLNLPPGCSFATRCAYTMPICDEPVKLYDFGGSHVARCVLYDERAKAQRPIEVDTAPPVGKTA